MNEHTDVFASVAGERTDGPYLVNKCTIFHVCSSVRERRRLTNISLLPITTKFTPTPTLTNKRIRDARDRRRPRFRFTLH